MKPTKYDKWKEGLNDFQKTLPEFILELAFKYELVLPEDRKDGKKDFWLCHNNWIVKHDGCEKIAKIENISFDPPTTNMDISPSVCLLIKGFKVDVETDSVVKSEWSFGEASAKNTSMPYWWAMAEKRGKDRVILKMIGAYEKGLYSEVEADEWKQQLNDSKNQPQF